MTYIGSCHCGKVAFEVEGELTGAISCNCSICTRNGSLLWMVPDTQFKLLTGEEDLTRYTFNKHIIQHQFCSTCGVESFSHGVDPKGNKMFAVNIHCLENADIESLPVHHYDGKAL